MTGFFSLDSQHPALDGSTKSRLIIWACTLWMSIVIPTKIEYNHHRHSESSKYSVSKIYLTDITTLLWCSFTRTSIQQVHGFANQRVHLLWSRGTHKTSESQQNMAWCEEKQINIFCIQRCMLTQVRLSGFSFQTFKIKEHNDRSDEIWNWKRARSSKDLQWNNW